MRDRELDPELFIQQYRVTVNRNAADTWTIFVHLSKDDIVSESKTLEILHMIKRIVSERFDLPIELLEYDT
ncbi:MAG: hypothetical protein OEM52_07655, partial [bacterium]|nr:hypothetical protein [bacterium]